MKLKLAFSLTVVISTLLFTGCRLTPEARSVFVHSQISNLLDDCERLGRVSASSFSYDEVKGKVRHDAYIKYGADTIAIVNIDHGLKTTIQAIAFKCNK